jgi:hypothetical protein
MIFILSIIMLSPVTLGSCRSALSSRGGGKASLSLQLAGVVPPTGGVTAVTDARILLPTTSSISVTVSGDGFARESVVPYSSTAGSSVTVKALPHGDPLSITVSALSASGAVLTTWTGTATLASGTNTLTATLKPTAIPTALSPVTTNSSPVDIASGISLAYGEALFYQTTISVTDSYTQLLFDSGKARWVWMGVYDSSWNELGVAAVDRAQGWVVLKPPADGIVRIVLSNGIASPGYPAGTITGSLQARRAYFVTTSGGGSGWAPTDPTALPGTITGSSTWLLQEGSYSISSGVAPLSGGNVRLYGGFKSGDWKVREPAVYKTVITKTTYGTAMNYPSSSTGAIDGLTVVGGPPNVAGSSVGLGVQTSATLVVSNCTLSGNLSTATTNATASSSGLASTSGNALEVSACAISGGVNNAGASYTATTYGVNFTTSAVLPYIHDCVIDGGIATGAIAKSYGAYMGNGSTGTAILARCRIWGGSATAATGAATAIGVYSITAGSTIANCVISGGFASASSSTCTTSGIQAQNAVFYVGCTIDGGYGSGGTVTSSAVTTINTAGAVGSCALLVSSPSGIRAALYENTSGPTSFSGNGAIGCPALNREGATYADFSTSTATTKVNNAISGGAPSGEFSYYTAPTTYSNFIELDWRPKSGAAVAGTPS